MVRIWYVRRLYNEPRAAALNICLLWPSLTQVFHLHDPRPATELFAMQAARAVYSGRSGRSSNFRGYDFPEGAFPKEGQKVRRSFFGQLLIS